MKSIQEISQNLQYDQASTTQHERPKQGISDDAALVINTLFKELRAIFPAWKHAYPTAEALNQAKKTWSKAFIENGVVTLKQIHFGLRRARKSGTPMMPSVGQFIEWCKPEMGLFGLPDERVAYLEACTHGRFASEHDWSHEAVYAAGQATGFFELSNRPETETYPLFKRNYDIVCRRVMNGESLDVTIPKALPTRATTQPTSCESAKAKIADIRAKVGLKKRS